MKTIGLVKHLREVVSSLQKEGSPIAFVPTMGNLHQGHLDLIAQAQLLCPGYKIITTIFVNPLQFTGAGGSDFEKYPRTLEDDKQKLETAGCHILFAPETIEEIYPKYPKMDTIVNVGEIGKILEGEFRPGTFEGVATVVLILINLCKPSAIFMGEKDWQQLLVVRQFVLDLHIDVQVFGVPTRREDSGLAMSSRNIYLTSEERMRATEIYSVLKRIEIKLKNGDRNFEEMEETGRQDLTAVGFLVQYFTIRNLNLTLPNPSNLGDQCVILVAAMLNSTRLIDNLVVKF